MFFSEHLPIVVFDCQSVHILSFSLSSLPLSLSSPLPQAGIEYCDGSARLSVVVTNVFSDWSTQPWPSTAARLRLHKINKGAVAVHITSLQSARFNLTPATSHFCVTWFQINLFSFSLSFYSSPWLCM